MAKKIIMFDLPSDPALIKYNKLFPDAKCEDIEHQ